MIRFWELPESFLLEVDDLREGGGFSLDLWLKLESLEEGQMIADTTASSGVGLRLCTGPHGTLRLEMSDGRSGSYWDSDAGLLQTGKWHHAAVIVDGGPKLILFVMDGILCDGGEERPFGWGRFNRELRSVTSGAPLRTGTSRGIELAVLRFYNRALRTSEAVGNFQAGKD
ncbi:LamG domain-containing protein [Paenibacillus sp. YN15]|uniref:LamG domain-containing protein n=1 Tax=Paenibacillus sp. YN15 TaxID=1742774 RepID=UPI0015EBD8CC|nr:LamG domain-containing protein [Paenibacillus sp. YN15]